MVNWRWICSPKEFGGLGIKNLECYGRALRLRWLWFQWDDTDRPWKGSATPCVGSDFALFEACTKITVGDGSKTLFWKDNWLNGSAPAKLAPTIFKRSRCKSISIKDGFQEGRWMRGLSRLNSEEELQEFLSLWEVIQNVQLSSEADSISWRLTANGVYSAKSAYDAHCIGRIREPALNKVWKLKTEGKVRFYYWLLLQNKTWTADRLLRRGWPHDPICKLCDREPESAVHLLLNCSFARQIWADLSVSDPEVSLIGSSSTSVSSWWHKLNCISPKRRRMECLSVACYMGWHIWKERNRRVFQNSCLTAQEVYLLAKAELCLLQEARG